MALYSSISVRVIIMNPEKAENEDLSSLEETSTVVESSPTPPVVGSPGSDTIDASSPAQEPDLAQPPSQTKPSKPDRFSWPKKLLKRFNVYLILFVLIVLIAVIVTGLSLYSNNKASSKQTITSQSLSSSTLKQLANSDATIGGPKQVLNVQSDAVFGGKVLVRDSLEVAGTIQVGGSLTLPGITVSGNSSFDQVQIRNTLSVGGNTSLQGQLSVQKGLSVTGNATFGGSVTAAQINTSNLQITGDFILTHHIVAGGSTPSRSNGSALGSGGTSSVSGSDSAGTISINTGGAPAAGCFATVSFTQKFNNTPHVIVTPVGSVAGSLNYYVNRTTSSFSICTANAAPASQSFAFDYFVVD